MLKKKNKKAAIEMSIGTIVVIVIAMVMLIMGVVLVRKIMCSGIILTDEISEKTGNEIKNLFDSSEYGVKCMGEGGNEVKLGGGGRRQVICVINTDTQAEYKIKIKSSIDALSGITDTQAQLLLLDSGWNGKIAPGTKTVTVGVLNVPRDINNAAIKMSFDVTDVIGGTTETHDLYIDLVPGGALSAAIC